MISTISTISLPHELWDEIAHCVGSAADLLSLALVCRDLSAIVLPHHIHYRRIRCNISRDDVWRHLTKHRHCARGIRSVELVDEQQDGVRLPPSLMNPTTVNVHTIMQVDTMASLLRSLLHMPALETFGWKAAPPKYMDAISPVLVHSANNLRALWIDFAWYQDQDGVSLPGYGNILNSLPLWKLSNLTRVILNDICKSAQEMLIHRCPNLEDLFISGYSHCSLILEIGSWKNLRRLSLQGLLTFFHPHSTSSNQNNIVINFFRRHTNLECVQVAVNSFPSRPSRHDASFLPDLPNLRSLSWQGYMTSKPSFFLAESCLSRLIHYKIASFELDHTLKMPNLDTLQVSLDQWYPHKLCLVFQNAPSIQKLSFDGFLSPKEMKYFIEALQSANLIATHIHLSVLHLVELSELERLAESLSEIKSLQYLHVCYQGHMNYVKIDRNGIGEYLGYHLTPSAAESQIGRDPSEWGNFFYKF